MKLKRIFETGNHVAALAAKYARVQVISAYPITPQTSIVERLAEYVSSGELKAEYIRVESEHSALAVVIGASLMGTRAFTATSSQGLLLMHEMLHWASGARTPVVMVVVNRAVAPPWSIWTEYTDTMSQRDTGWIQFYVSNNQEIFDTIIQAYKIAEDRRVHLPFMVIFEGFTISHTASSVRVPEQEEVDDFLPPYQGGLPLDFSNPPTFGSLTYPEDYYKFRKGIEKSMFNAKETIKEVCNEYVKRFNINHGSLIQTRHKDESDVFIVTLGGLASESIEAVEYLRESGIKAGLIRIRCFRPFPREDLNKMLGNCGMVVTLDRSLSFGFEPQLYSEVRSSLYGSDVPVFGAIVGIGGKEVNYKSIAKVVKHFLTLRKSGIKEKFVWWDY